MERAADAVNRRLALQSVGQQISSSFETSDDESSFLDRVALASELAAMEGLDALSRPDGGDGTLRDQAVAASSRAFDIRRLQPIPETTHDRLFVILQVSALACCGDRWSDLRRWYRENSEALIAPSVSQVPWDQRLFYRLFHCWVRLFRKDGWDDLDRIRETIAGLREDQRTMERGQLGSGSSSEARAMALRLAALYHWARVTEIVAQYMLQGDPVDPFGQMDKHFEAGIRAATESGDAQHELILLWLHAAGRVMLTSSPWWTTRSVSSSNSVSVRSLASLEPEPEG